MYGGFEGARGATKRAHFTPTHGGWTTLSTTGTGAPSSLLKARISLKRARRKPRVREADERPRLGMHLQVAGEEGCACLKLRLGLKGPNAG